MEGVQISALRKAIENTNPEILRRALIEMCESSSEIRELAESHLLVNITSKNASKENSRKRRLGSTSGIGHGLVQRIQMCLQCKEMYDVTENAENSCVWHEGTKGVVGFDKGTHEGDSFWDKFDWEDWRDGSPSDLADDPEYAEGFRWTCCNGYGDTVGCRVTKHRHDMEDPPESSEPGVWSDLPKPINQKISPQQYGQAQYPPQGHSSHPSQGGQYYPPQQGYPTQHQPDYLPQHQGYPPQHQPGYPPQHQQGYPPQNQYPQQGYPRSYSPSPSPYWAYTGQQYPPQPRQYDKRSHPIPRLSNHHP